MKRSPLFVLLIGALWLAACVPATAVPPTDTPAVATDTPAPTNTAAAPTDTTAPPTATTAAPTDTTAPTATTAPSETAAPATATTGPTAAVTASPAPTAGVVAYIDDRSDPAALMTSFASAINLHQYLRAYFYWRPGAAGLPTFEVYEAGYSNTQSIQISLGAITGDAGAGQLYYSVPTKLVAQTTGGAQTFVGCYILHLSQPGIQGAPPFQGLSINSATVNQVANNADTTPLLAAACQATQSLPLQVTPAPDPNDITAARYLDDRTDAVQVLRSLFNSVNRKEYVRAYSYWEANAVGLPAYNQFEQGYANTQVVTLTVGTVSEDAGAGQRYWTVPVTLKSTTTANVTQTFVACYTLHLGLPDAQGVPPYQPIGIRSAKVSTVANNADTATLMGQICQQG